MKIREYQEIQRAVPYTSFVKDDRIIRECLDEQNRDYTTIAPVATPYDLDIIEKYFEDARARGITIGDELDVHIGLNVDMPEQATDETRRAPLPLPSGAFSDLMIQ